MKTIAKALVSGLFKQLNKTKQNKTRRFGLVPKPNQTKPSRLLVNVTSKSFFLASSFF